MGTHPIFESDFDCLTELNRRERVSLPHAGEKFGEIESEHVTTH